MERSVENWKMHLDKRKRYRRIYFMPQLCTNQVHSVTVQSFITRYRWLLMDWLQMTTSRSIIPTTRCSRGRGVAIKIHARFHTNPPGRHQPAAVWSVFLWVSLRGTMIFWDSHRSEGETNQAGDLINILATFRSSRLLLDPSHPRKTSEKATTNAQSVTKAIYHITLLNLIHQETHQTDA